MNIIVQSQIRYANRLLSHNLLQTHINNYSYISMKRIKQIRQQTSQLSFLKTVSKICSYYLSQSLSDFKHDYSIYKTIKHIPYSKRSMQEKLTYRRIKSNIIKFIPAMIVFNVPFGFPLFYLYFTFFPQLIPLWMMVDSVEVEIKKQRNKRRIQAYRYYAHKYNQELQYAYLKEAINKDNQSLQDLRRISLICYGDYIDGTEYLHKKLNVSFNNGFITPNLSIRILKIYLQNQLKHDYSLQNQFNKLNTFQEKIFYKLETQLQKLKKQQKQISN